MPSPRIAAAAASAAAMCFAKSSPRVAAAQTPAAAASTDPLGAVAARTTIGGEWLQLGAGPVHRHASVSMGATLGYDLTPRMAGLRLDLGWLRAARPASTAQGITAGLSLPILVPGTATRLSIRPGLAGMTGWAESQSSHAVYDWRGLPGTPYNGLTGTEGTDAVARSRATGLGAILGAELQIAGGVAATGSVRRWAYSGTAIRPNRNVTLAGFGLAFRPGRRNDAATSAGHATTAATTAPARVAAAPFAAEIAGRPTAVSAVRP